MLDNHPISRPPGIYAKPCLEFLAKRYSSNIPLNIKVPAWDTFAIKTQPESKGASTSKVKYTILVFQAISR